MFQTIGEYLNTLLVIGVGIAGRYYAPRWVRKDGTAEEVERRLARTRKLCTVLLVLGIGMLIFQLVGI